MDAPVLHPPALPTTEYDQCVVLRDVSWAQYEALGANRGDSAVPRLTYDRGLLEIMSPSANHERIKSTLARLLEWWSVETGTGLNAYGSWTIKQADVERGLEPDECYIVTTQPGPRPDLAVEVIWTSRLVDKLDVYAALGVPEVWIWQDSRISVHVLRSGAYERAARSVLLPALDLELLARLAAYEDQVLAVQTLRDSLRTTPT